MTSQQIKPSHLPIPGAVAYSGSSRTALYEAMKLGKIEARNRAGMPCRCPAMKGKVRCRMHGGASGSGAPKGERNGMWKHGGFTGEAIALRRAANHLLREIGR